jgi:predicted AAA+ superfamily ATPase
MTLLQATYLVQLLPAWSSNIGLRLVKAPKVHLNDTGLISALLALNAERLLADAYALGGLLETFVAMEIRKELGVSETKASLFHYRSQNGQEVDLLLEDPRGRLVGIEVRASGTLHSSDFKGLRALRELAGDRFLRGVILYFGTQVVPFGNNLHALPLAALWRCGKAAAP